MPLQVRVLSLPPMKLLSITQDELMALDNESQFEHIHNHHVVIVNGTIVKNRNGIAGVKIGDSLYIWEEMELK